MGPGRVAEGRERITGERKDRREGRADLHERNRLLADEVGTIDFT